MKTGISVYVFLVGFALLPIFVVSFSYNDTNEVHKYLFNHKGYNKKIRPVENQDEPVFVFVDLFLLGITSLNEVQEKLTTTAYLSISWYDAFLEWDPNMFNGVDKFQVPQSDIWIPDIALQNGFTQLKKLGSDFILALVGDDGYVGWFPFEVFETKCAVDIKYFPFDKQICDIRFRIWTSDFDEVQVILKSDAILMDEYHENGQWDVLSTSATAFLSVDYESVISFSITIKRNPDYTMINIVLPIMMLSILSVCTFIIPIESGEKMGYSVTVYLAFAVFLTIVSSFLPETATMSLLSTYLLLLLSIGTTIVIITALELRLHHRDNSREMPGCAKCVVRFFRKSQYRKSRKIQTCNDMEIVTLNRIGSQQEIASPVPELESSIGNITWADVTSTIDLVCFWVLLFVVSLSTILLLVIGYKQ